jgi:CDP-diacylglycerol---serine O-phosphatidyltransferase
MTLSSSSKKTKVPISRLFPSMVTIMAICFGMTAIRYALKQQWDIATTFIIISGFLDVVDGRLARYLKATSNFGAQLDSLADFINFGIAPAIVLYLWGLNQIEIKGLGWGLVLFYSICSAIRLARFNSNLAEPNRAAWKDAFFTGIPAPAGAYLALIPLMISFNFNILEYIHPIAIGIYLMIIGILMASRIPTFATKKLVIKKEHISFVLVIAGILIGSIIMEPWITLPFLGIIYVLTFPCSILYYRRLELASQQ